MQPADLLELVRASFLKDGEKAELERELASASKGECELVLEKFLNYLRADIASRGERFAGAFGKLEEDHRAADETYAAGKERLTKEIEAELDALADNDFDARDAAWEQYDKELEHLELERMERVKAAALAALMS